MINFEDRLKSLKNRRQGYKNGLLHESAINSFDLENYKQRQEAYESLKELNSIKYVIGAMAPVEKSSTNISISEGQRVADNLMKSLATRGIDTVSRLQGSVALDIHIEGHSDVDMLIIKKDIVQFEQPSINTYYQPNDTRPMVDIIKELRLESEGILRNNFSKVNVDCKGNKSISMGGGSLQRKIDIVPACWYDTRDYQRTEDESDRGVKIYLKKDHELLLNLPFKHIKLISDKDLLYEGNLKMVIRLMKNMIADMPEYKKNITERLSSYDLASIAYYMNDELSLSYDMRLGLVEKTKVHLYKLFNNEYCRNSLYVPDGSRKIFDEQEKVKSLGILANEFNDLALAIVKDLRPFINTYDSSVILNKRVA